ncbi:hypothetical protein SEA_GAUGELDP_77 [Mycobacterium phage GaugeLDP]|nr:hypothetical protein SEA_GAUGELDP_77 [Mycobacterium phage GaugeLDP]
MRWVAVWFAVGMTVFGMALAVAYSPPAHAEVSAQCWAHLAEIPPGETPAGDRRYHLLRGEPSPCSEQEVNEAQGREEVATRGAASSSKPKEDNDGKSRFCRKRWYC